MDFRCYKYNCKIIRKRRQNEEIIESLFVASKNTPNTLKLEILMRIWHLLVASCSAEWICFVCKSSAPSAAATLRAWKIARVMCVKLSEKQLTNIIQPQLANLTETKTETHSTAKQDKLRGRRRSSSFSWQVHCATKSHIIIIDPMCAL